MKSFFLKLFLKDKFIGQLAALATAFVVSYAAIYLPGAPEVVTLAVRTLFDLPAGAPLDHLTLSTVLTPLIKIVIGDVVQAVVVKWNNRTLVALKQSDDSSYSAAVDGFVGPKALEAIEDVLHRFN